MRFSSVEAAVRQVEEAIDTKIAPYRGNAIVENMAEQLKEKYRQEIFDRAAAARLEEQVKSVSSCTTVRSMEERQYQGLVFRAVLKRENT
jgi:hypothetical protein